MYLNLIEIAESFGVSESVIRGWVRNEGLPHTEDGRRLLFDRAQVAHWAAGRGLASQVGFLAPVRPAFSDGLSLGALLKAGGIWRDVSPTGVTRIFQRVATSLPQVTPAVCQLLAARLGAEDGVTLAPVGGGFALPHPRVRIALGRDSGAVALIMLNAPLSLTEARIDDVPVRHLLFFLAPSPRAHLDLLARLGHLLTQGPLADLIRANAPDEELVAAMVADDRPRPAVPPPASAS